MSSSAPSFFSDFDVSGSPKPFSFSAGQILRKAREARHLTLDEISQRLCLSRSVLEALEEGRYRDLSQGEAYLMGFVRSYARLVDIDPKRVALQMKEEFPPCENPPELIFPVPLPPAGRPKKLALFFSILMTMGGVFVGQKFLMEAESPEFSASTPFVPVQVTVSSQREGQIKASAEEKIKPFTADEEKRLGSPAFFSLIEAADVQQTASSSASLVLEATEKSWIEVRDNQGHVHASKTMEPGDVYETPESASLLLTTGNMGGLRVRQGKETIDSLGKKGAVRHKIPLTFTTLRSLSKQ